MAIRGTQLHGPYDVRFEERPDPQILQPTDAIIRVSVTCVCGSDLWPYRGIDRTPEPTAIGHEYCGIVEEVGAAVTSIRPGQFVIGSFVASDGTCPHCRAGFHYRCVQREPIKGAQAEVLRVPLADGTLVALPEVPDTGLCPSLLTASDVLGTAWFAAVSADVQPGMTVAVVGDGAVGLLGVLVSAVLGAERIIAMSRNPQRQRLAGDFGATDVVAERGTDAVERVLDMTGGVGVDATLECVGTAEAVDQAIGSTRPGGFVGCVGIPHDVSISGRELFLSQVAVRGGPAPVRRFLPDLVRRICEDGLDPSRVFDLALPLDRVGDAYEAMDDRSAIKVLLWP